MGANVSCVAEKGRKNAQKEEENDEKDQSTQATTTVTSEVGVAAKNDKKHDLHHFIPSSNQMKNINTQLRFIKPLGKGASGHVVLATYQKYFEPDLSIVYGDTCDNGDITSNVNYIETPHLPAAINSINNNHSSSIVTLSSNNNSFINNNFNNSGSSMVRTVSATNGKANASMNTPSRSGTGTPRMMTQGSFHFLDKMDNERFALKIISKKHKSNKQLFYNEVSLLNKLSNCDAIVHLITCYMDDENYYIATEYCTGGALLDVIYKCQYFTEQQASYYIKSILNTIEYMHSLNIIHGDLKPGNIVFDKIPIFNEHFDGKSTSKLFVNDAKLIIIDFGEALEIENEWQEYVHVSGTLVYLPPELCYHKARNGFDLKMGDMWTIGIISYILLVGKLPFFAQNKDATLRQITTHSVPWPTFHDNMNGDGNDSNNNNNNKRCQISERGKDFVNKLLNKFPKRRITASNALKHDWIMDNQHNPREKLKIVELANKELLDNIGNFKDAPPLEKILVNHAIAELTNDDRQWLKAQFRKIDRNKLGMVNIDDICDFLLKTDESLTKEEANTKAAKLMSMMDPTNTGQITLKDFVRAKTLSLLHTHLGSNEEIQLKGFERLSNILDKDNTGKIDSKLLEAELARSLTNAEKTLFMTQVCHLQTSTEYVATIKPDFGSESTDLNTATTKDNNSNNSNNNGDNGDNTTNSSKPNSVEFTNAIGNLETTNKKFQETESSKMIDLKLVEYLGSMSPSDIENETDFDNDTYERLPSIRYGSTMTTMNVSVDTTDKSNNINNSSVNTSHASDEIEIEYKSQAQSQAQLQATAPANGFAIVKNNKKRRIKNKRNRMKQNSNKINKTSDNRDDASADSSSNSV